jgi:hypothetical protein
LAEYRVAAVTGDSYSGDIIQERFRELGIEYLRSEKTKSEIYSSFLPVLNSTRVELLDHPRLIAQLASLERRVVRGSGREIIDHPSTSRGGEHHDDVINAVAAAALLAVARPPHRARAGFGWRASDGTIVSL